MALNWLHIDEKNIFGLAPASTVVSAAVEEGLFLGIDSDGLAVLAENGSDGETPVEARGASWADGTYGTTDVTLYKPILSYVTKGKLYGFSGLTPGGTIYLNSGGGITQTEPATPGDLKQELGFALSADTVWVDIHPAELLT